MPLTLQPLAYALGAAITGLDLRERQSDETIAVIRQAWLDHLVLWFPGQDLTPEQQMAFCSRFGELDDHR
jgi:taurine dioxygenase